MSYQAAYTIYGSESSPYSIKVRAYARHKRAFSFAWENARTSAGYQAVAKIPIIPAVRAPDGTGATSDDDAWRRSAYEDYLWMAREFNRQYMNSHGKQHPDYQPHSANSELQTHHLNGRLWCFLGSVTTRPSPSLRRLHPTPPSSTLPSQTFAVRPR